MTCPACLRAELEWPARRVSLVSAAVLIGLGLAAWVLA